MSTCRRTESVTSNGPGGTKRRVLAVETRAFDEEKGRSDETMESLLHEEQREKQRNEREPSGKQKDRI